MHRRSRVAQSVAAVLFAAAVAACSGNGTTQKTAGAAAGDSAPATGSEAGTLRTQPLSDFPGATGQRLADYIGRVNQDLFLPQDIGDYSRLANVKFPCQSCEGGTAHFLVVPVKHAKTIKWDEQLQTSTAQEAEVVAAFINLDNVNVPELNLFAGDAMYLWIGHLAGTDSRGVGLYAYNSASKTKAAVAGTKTFYICVDPDHANPKPATKINPQHQCEPSARTASGGPIQFATSGVPFYPDGLWISCSSGCCKMDPMKKFIDVTPMKPEKS